MKKIVFLWMVLLLLISGNISVSAQTWVVSGNFQFSSFNNAASVKALDSMIVGDIIIPDSFTIDGVKYAVEQIEDYGFTNCSHITSVTMGKNIKRPGSQTFKNCTSLKKADLSKASFTDFPISYFNNCISLTDVALPDSLDRMYAGWQFVDCKSLKSIKIPVKVDSIGNSCFSGCTALTDVDMPEGLLVIDDNTFKNDTSLVSIHVPNSVKEIGWQCFEYCTNLTSFTVPANTFKVEHLTLADCPRLKEIKWSGIMNALGYGAFMNDTALVGKLELPEGITSIIEGWCFQGCKNLTEVVLPNTLKEWGDGIFYNCTNLQTVNIPNLVTNIPTDCFEQCENLKKIDIPSNIKIINSSAFMNCSNLRFVKIANSVKTIGNSAFSMDNNLHHLTLPSQLDSLADIFSYGDSIEEITIPATVSKSEDILVSGYNWHLKSIYIMGNKIPEVYKNYADEIKIYYPDFSKTHFIYLKKSVYDTGTYQNDTTWAKVATYDYKVPVTFTNKYKSACRDFDMDLTDAILSKGLKAYVATSYDEANNNVVMKQVSYVPSRTRANEAGFVGYDTYHGVILEGTPGETAYYMIGEKDYTTGANQTYFPTTDKNLLIGANDETNVTMTEIVDGTEYKHYGLKNDCFSEFISDGILDYNKCYLSLPTSQASSKVMTMTFHNEDGTTRIENVPEYLKNDVEGWFNISGQRVASPSKGIYIHNGKKITIK